jgi:hypothetical protein
MRCKIESAAKEAAAAAIVFKRRQLSEAAGVGFECLDFGVKTLGEWIGNAVLKIGQQSAEMSLK